MNTQTIQCNQTTSTLSAWGDSAVYLSLTQRCQLQKQTGKKAEDQKRFKRGDVNNENGKVFWSYSGSYERWLPLDVFKKRKEGRRKQVKKRKPLSKYEAYTRKGRYVSIESKLKILCGSRIRAALIRKGDKIDIKLPSDIREWIGCDWPELKKDLESKFLPGMSWSNWTRTGWHIDHFEPLAPSVDGAEFIARCHFSNLHPLWREINQAKSSL